jgi:hypothetical protein
LAATFVELWETHKRPEMQNAVEQACTQLRRFASIYPIGTPSAQLYNGRLAWLTNNATRAKGLWRKSIATAQRFEMPYCEAVGLYELGRHLPQSDARALPHLREALSIFERLQATYELERVYEAIEQRPLEVL